MVKTAAIVAIVAAVVVVGGGAAAAVVIMNNNEDKTPTVTVLVEDQNGVYFWTEGKGDTIADALAKTSDGVTVTMTDASFGKYISEINGLKEDYTSSTCYWSIYIYDGETWKASELGASNMNTKDYETIGLFYVVSDPVTYEVTAGGPTNVTVPSVNDKVIWDGSTKGTVFALKGASGMYFYTNSNKEGTMADRFAAMTEEFKIPFESSKSGIKTLFGIGSVEVEPGVWSYWAQFGLIDGQWGYMPTTMPNTDNPDDYSQFAVVYGDGGMGSTNTPLPPIYAE